MKSYISNAQQFLLVYAEKGNQKCVQKNLITPMFYYIHNLVLKIVSKTDCFIHLLSCLVKI